MLRRSKKERLDKYILQIGQIYWANWTNIFCKLDKYKFGPDLKRRSKEREVDIDDERKIDICQNFASYKKS